MNILISIAIGAVAVVAIGWLAVSFLAPTRGRSVIEWLTASALYVALASFFVSLLLGAESIVGQVGFGFLSAVFGIGLVLALVKTLGAARGRSGPGASATN